MLKVSCDDFIEYYLSCIPRADLSFQENLVFAHMRYLNQDNEYREDDMIAECSSINKFIQRLVQKAIIQGKSKISGELFSFAMKIANDVTDEHELWEQQND